MYDAIVIGARCAGSPTAMLLARKGMDVLLVDRARFPSDTLSSHYIHQPGVAALARWGLLDAVSAAGAPAIREYTLDVGPFALHGAPPPLGDVAEGRSLRRDRLDEILVRAAADAGAQVREAYPVDELLVEDGRLAGIRSRGQVERARIVVGADGLNSLVARTVDAPVYEETGTLTCAYYTYFEGVPMDGVELYPRPGRMIVAAPTNDGQVVVVVFWPVAEFPAVRKAVERSFLQTLELAPSLAERVRGGTRTDRFRGSARLPNRYRRPYGPGWALVGDAGYHKDPILALGITDAFRDAELLADAIATGDLAGYERRRNALSAHGFQTTLGFARLQGPSPELQELLVALRDDPEGRNRFFGVIAGTVPPDALTPPRRPAAPSAAA